MFLHGNSQGSKIPEEHVITSVNKHYLERVLSRAEQADLTVTEDIVDARGTKLIAKGAKISRVLQERLTIRKLSKPFESSIAVASMLNEVESAELQP